MASVSEDGTCERTEMSEFVNGKNDWNIMHYDVWLGENDPTQPSLFIALENRNICIPD